VSSLLDSLRLSVAGAHVFVCKKTGLDGFMRRRGIGCVMYIHVLIYLYIFLHLDIYIFVFIVIFIYILILIYLIYVYIYSIYMI
jgi:hypothetical protein